MLNTKRDKKDRILVLGESPLDRRGWLGSKNDEWVDEVGELGEEEMMVSGEMEVGGSNHPVTIKITDEVTGMEMEMAHVKNALFVIEDERRSSSGWLSLVIGDINKISGVLRFIAKATVDELRKFARGRKGREN